MNVGQIVFVAIMFCASILALIGACFCQNKDGKNERSMMIFIALFLILVAIVLRFGSYEVNQSKNNESKDIKIESIPYLH